MNAKRVIAGVTVLALLIGACVLVSLRSDGQAKAQSEFKVYAPVVLVAPHSTVGEPPTMPEADR